MLFFFSNLLKWKLSCGIKVPLKSFWMASLIIRILGFFSYICTSNSLYFLEYFILVSKPKKKAYFGLVWTPSPATLLHLPLLVILSISRKYPFKPPTGCIRNQRELKGLLKHGVGFLQPTNSWWKHINLISD